MLKIRGVLLRESIAIFAEKTRGFAKMQIKTTKLQEISQLLGILRVLRVWNWGYFWVKKHFENLKKVQKIMTENIRFFRKLRKKNEISALEANGFPYEVLAISLR